MNLQIIPGLEATYTIELATELPEDTPVVLLAPNALLRVNGTASGNVVSVTLSEHDSLMNAQTGYSLLACVAGIPTRLAGGMLIPIAQMEAAAG